jgi:hypothetical protein
MELQLVKNEMANLILTECDFLVPVDRVCFGSPTFKKKGLCEKCQIYAEKKEKQKSTFLFQKGRVFGSKRVSLVHVPCAVQVEANL